MLLGRGGVGHLRHFDWAMDVLQIGWVGEGERGGGVGVGSLEFFSRAKKAEMRGK